MARRPLHAESQRAASWSARLGRLEFLLSAAPHSAQAWRWRLQAKVLRFLLARYGSRTDLDEARPDTEAPAAPLEIVLPDQPKPPMAPLKMRRVLVRVAQGNFHKVYDPLPPPLPDKPKPVYYPSPAAAFLLAHFHYHKHGRLRTRWLLATRLLLCYGPFLAIGFIGLASWLGLFYGLYVAAFPQPPSLP